LLKIFKFCNGAFCPPQIQPGALGATAQPPSCFTLLLLIQPPQILILSSWPVPEAKPHNKLFRKLIGAGTVLTNRIIGELLKSQNLLETLSSKYARTCDNNKVLWAAIALLGGIKGLGVLNRHFEKVEALVSARAPKALPKQRGCRLSLKLTMGNQRAVAWRPAPTASHCD